MGVMAHVVSIKFQSPLTLNLLLHKVALLYECTESLRCLKCCRPTQELMAISTLQMSEAWENAHPDQVFAWCICGGLLSEFRVAL